MKVRIGSYDVEISAKNWVLGEEGTLNFLNDLSQVYREAGRYNEEYNYPVSADENFKAASTIFKVCMENELYEGIK